jgi:hypothetical protein
MIDRLFDMRAVDAALADPTGWRGSHDGKPVFFEKDLSDQLGFKVTLHRFVAADAAHCFHSHPATAIRAVLRGGYVEEFHDGSFATRSPGYTGLVWPEVTHRIHQLLDADSVSLWIRMPKTHSVDLLGDGWNTHNECNIDKLEEVQ